MLAASLMMAISFSPLWNLSRSMMLTIFWASCSTNQISEAGMGQHCSPDHHSQALIRPLTS